MYYNETINPTNAKYSGIKYRNNYTCIKSNKSPYFFDDRYNNRLLKLKNKCYCCYMSSQSK